jgi:hypothetical protein
METKQNGEGMKIHFCVCYASDRTVKNTIKKRSLLRTPFSSIGRSLFLPKPKKLLLFETSFFDNLIANLFDRLVFEFEWFGFGCLHKTHSFTETSTRLIYSNSNVIQ